MMLDKTDIALNKDSCKYTAVDKNWNMQQLYQRIEAVKISKQQQPLTELEQFCLQGLLSGYTPQEITDNLRKKLDYSRIQVTFWTLFRYIQIMAGKESETITSFQDIIDSLEVLGYRSENADTILITNRLAIPDTFTSATNSITDTESHIIQTKHIKPSDSQPNYNALTTVDERDFMPPVSLWTRLGGLFLVGSVGVAIAVAALTPYRVTVRGNAKIRPDSKIKVVQAETSGTIASIKVRENQSVTRGDIIATIDNSSLETEANLLQNQIQQGKLQTRQITAQIAALDLQIIAETERINNSIAEAKAELNRTRREYRDRQITTTAEVAEAQANLNLSEVELEQARSELISARASLKSQQAALESAKSKRDRYQAIADSGALSRDILQEANLDYQQQIQEVKAQQATVTRYQGAIARQRQAIAAAKARLNNISAALDPSDAEVAISQKRIAQTKASGNATLATLNREKEALKQQQIEAQKQIERDRRQLQQILLDRDRSNIKASSSGTVFQLNLRNTGQNVEPGTEIAQIAPRNSSLLALAHVDVRDINQIEVGQPAQLRLSACPYPDYGTLPGTVTQVSPDAIPISENSPNLYEVTIEPARQTLSQGTKKCTLQLGMEARADIIAREETVLRFLLRKARLLVDL